jgi:hypothetical protein
LFKPVFTDLEFTKRNKIKIEDIIILFVSDECSEKFNNTTKGICSSGHLQNLIIKTLDAEAIS